MIKVSSFAFEAVRTKINSQISDFNLSGPLHIKLNKMNKITKTTTKNMVYLHKPSNCFILSNIFQWHKQRWKKCSILLKFNMLGGIPRVYVGVPPNLHKEEMFIFHALCALLNSKTYQK